MQGIFPIILYRIVFIDIKEGESDMASRRTDLAVELQEGLAQPLHGVYSEEKKLANGISYTRVNIEDEQAGENWGIPAEFIFRCNGRIWQEKAEHSCMNLLCRQQR